MRWMSLLLIGLLLPLGSVFAQGGPPMPINYGQSVSGELNDIQQALQYAFDAQSGDSITLVMQTTSGDLNAALSLSTFEGDLIAQDDDSGGGTDALIQVEIETAGAYVITATRSASALVRGAGSFTLTLNSGQLPIAAGDVQVGPRLQPIQRGTPIQGSLTSAARFNLLWFEGRTNETISLVLDPGTALQPLLVLYNASFVELLRSRPPSPLAVNLPSDGLYFVAVALPDSTSDGGSYSLTLNTGTSTATDGPPREVQPGQSAIAYGESVRGTISAAATAFTFQFRGRANDPITVSMARAGGDLDSYIYLLDSGGVTLAEDDNGGGTNGDARLSVNLPADGDYLILATRQGQSSGSTAGNFLLTLASDAEPVTIPTATTVDKPANLAALPEINVGQTLSGTISNSVFIVPYVFWAEADQELLIRMDSTSDLDPFLILLQANQEPIAQNDDIVDGEDQNSQIEFTAPESGYYVVVATRFDQENGTTEGSYNLTVRLRDSQANAALAENQNPSALIRRLEADPIIPGGTPSDSFESLRFANVYSVGITNPQSLIDFSVNTDGNLATTIILADENLQPITVTDSGTLLGVSVPQAGNYVFIVAPADGPSAVLTEAYVLAFNAEGESPLANATEESPDSTEEAPDGDEIETLQITYGQRVTGQITEDINEIDYRFSGVAGDTVRIRMNAIDPLGLDPLVRLLDADGTIQAENDDIVAGENRDSLMQVTLTEDGEYTIAATHFIPEDGSSASVGGYELILELVPPEAVGVSAVILPIASGQTVNNTINDNQNLLFYSFSANSGDVVTIKVDTLSGDLDGVLYLYAYTSSGQPVEIRRNDDSPRGGTYDPLLENISLPRAGDYLIAVGRFPDSNSTGDFAMTLTINPPGFGPSNTIPTPTQAATGE